MRRKQRALQELYNVTQIITVPEITPILKGSCRMQGPLDEIDSDIQTNTVSSQVDKGSSSQSKSQGIHVRVGSGTCNVCSTPCSSCLHFNQTVMGSNTHVFSNETCRENAFSYSVDEIVSTNSRKCDVGLNTNSEISNLISRSSSHDSVSENVESKASLRTFDVSVASEDVEMLPKLSVAGSVREDQHTSKPCDSDEKSLTTKFEEPKGLEGHDDNISCISTATGVNRFSSCDSGNTGRTNEPYCYASMSSLVPDACGKITGLQTSSLCLETKWDIAQSQSNSIRQEGCSEESIQKVSPLIRSSIELTAHNLGLLEIPSSKDIDDSSGSQNAQITDQKPPSGEFLSCKPNLKKSLGLSSHGEAPDCSGEILNSQIKKEKLVSKTDNGNDADDLPPQSLNLTEQTDADVVLDLKGTLSPSHPLDDSDESDISEHDVKVCDICGDAGREDSLAICCKCSDGAEHTYCMREMLDKVPEGDWLCEECKFDEENKSLKQDKVELVYRNENNHSSGQSSTEITDLSMKLSGKGSDFDENKANNEDQSSAKVSVKRHAEDAEVSSVSKKQALEPVVGLSKTSSPGRSASLSHDGSFKNGERGKLKPIRQFSSSTLFVSDVPETTPFSPITGPRSQTPRGRFLRSTSFNSSNAKPKVKPVDEVPPQKEKLARELASLETKEGTAHLLSKTMSFKSSNPGRLSTFESNFKMLSPKITNAQDLKSLKQSKEHNLFERKNSFKNERPLVNSVVGGSTVSTPKVDSKLASRGDAISFPSVSNNRELKVALSDGKSVSSLKPTSVHVARRGSDTPVPLGEVKRNIFVNGISSSTDRRSIQASHKDDSSLTSSIVERPLRNGIESLPDGLPRPRESINVVERIKEGSGSRSRQSIADGGRSVLCQKCKEVGHSAQFCTVETSRPLAASSTRSTREELNKGNKLKAAIEAAMLKKPGIYRKNRVPNQPDELSVSRLNCEIASQDQLTCSNNTRSMPYADEIHEGQAIDLKVTTDTSRLTIVDRLKKFMVLPSEAVTSRAGDANSNVPSDGKGSVIDLMNHPSRAMSALLKMTAIPQHEYVWQGHFEIHRSGKIPDLCDGIQAHLSTWASPKVLEVVNKFPSKVLLSEVPRTITWPIQFEESGVREDNIALYFFAKDLESYEDSFKILMERMMRSDLALKGHIEGVELLIFPSNQLPVKSQRWNMLFFLWGVFRGKRVNRMQHMPSFPKDFCISGDIPPPIVSLPEKICSLGPKDEGLPVYDGACDVAVSAAAPTLVELPCSSSPEMHQDCDTKLSSLFLQSEYVQINTGQQNSRLDSNFLSTIQKSSVQSCPEFKSSAISQEEHAISRCKPEAEKQASVEASRRCGTNESQKTPIDCDTTLDRQQISSVHVGRFSVSPQDTVSVGSIDGNKMSFSDAMVKILNHGKQPHMDALQTISNAAGTSQTMTWNDDIRVLVDGASASKKHKSGFGGFYGCDNFISSSTDGFTSGTHDVASSYLPKEKRCDEGRVTSSIPENSGNTERYFFPVDPRPVEEIELGDKSMPWKVFSPSNEDCLYDRAPNLELALGAETKPSNPGIPPFVVGIGNGKVNQDQPPEEAAIDEEDDDVAASLSLSLSFPFPDKEQAVKPVSKSEQLLAERQHVSTSLLLFGAFSDK